MPSGLRVDTDTWLRDLEQAKQAANDVLALIQARLALNQELHQCCQRCWREGLEFHSQYCASQDRNTKYPSGGPEASRATATARKKLGTLGTSLENLREALETGANADV